MPVSLRSVVSILLAAGTAAALVAVPTTQPAAAAATVSCADLSTEVLQRVRPAGEASLLTLWRNEADGAIARYGYQDRGTAFLAAPSPGTGLVAVHRLYAARSGDFLYTSDGAEIRRAVSSGYRDDGAGFYVSSSPSSCLTGVERFVKGSMHRLAATRAERDGLKAAGWQSEGVKFYAGPQPAHSAVAARRW